MESLIGNPKELQELKNHLLEGIQTVSPRAVECFEGTRTNILADVAAKTDDYGGPNVIWIRGAPGSGKSSISLTSKLLLHRQRRLVIYYRFDRNEAATTTSVALWRQVAYGLARRFPRIRPQMLQQLQDDEVDLDSSIAVFTSLVESALSELSDAQLDRSLVVVIDALDECGGTMGYLSPDRHALLKTLGRWSKLPKGFKLLVTGRAEGDLARVLSPISATIDIHSGNILDDNPHAQASIEAAQDIRMFLKSRFQQITAPLSSILSPDWPGTDTTTKMVYRAAGNFMWATVATNFIESGIDPQERLEIVMDNAPRWKCLQPLYLLYSSILETSFGKIAEGSSEAEVLRAVLGIIIFAQRPLDDVDYTKLPTTTPVTTIMIELIRDRLRSVIDQGRNLRFVHKSFDDFLLSEECPSKYAIRKDDSQYLLTELCLVTMKAELRFNMCKLETSCLKNAEVPDLGTRVIAGIPPLLSYSCCFWAEHLGFAPFDQGLLDQVRLVIFDTLLYWFEAMSLLREVNRVSHSLLLVLKWAHSSPDEAFKDFIHDARQFIGAFGQLITQSAPHIYISALPFAPKYSIVAQHYLERFPRILVLSTGEPACWSSCIFTLENLRARADRVVLSPDDARFASKSTDDTICIFDSETGNIVAGPLQGDESVQSIFFDPDGQCVWASFFGGGVFGWNIETGDLRRVFHIGSEIAYCGFNGDQTIISVSSGGEVAVWNAKTGKQLHYTQISDPGQSIEQVSLSPDGYHIACTIHDHISCTVKIWTLVNGSEIRQVFQSQSEVKFEQHFSAVSFSTDSDFVVSGQADGTIMIWDFKSGATVGRLQTTGGAMVDAVAYSPQNNLVVSASGDLGTVTVYNCSTHAVVLGPLTGHISGITAMKLTRNGRRALTGSSDGTVRMWDFSRKGDSPAIYELEGHSEQVSDVAFSPCGKKLASLGSDNTIRVWDVNSGKPLLDPIGNVAFYSRIIFSPDSKRILACCYINGTVGVWSADTGKPVFNRNITCDETLSKNSIHITHIAFRSTDHQLITCSSNGAVRIWTLEDGGMTEDLSDLGPEPILDGGQPIHVVALSPDGLTVVMYDENRSPRHYMWSTTMYERLPMPFAYNKRILAHPTTYSPSGRFFVATEITDYGSTLRVWNTKTGKLIARSSKVNGRIYCLAFSPDDRHIAFCYDTSTPGGKSIWIWDTSSGRLTSGPWTGSHSSGLTTLAFSPGGEKLVSGSGDGQIRLWNTTHLFGDSQIPPGFLGIGTEIQDGWVRDTGGRLLFWVPNDHRTKLVWPGTDIIIGGTGRTTQLDLSRFKYGKNWADCFRGWD